MRLAVQVAKLSSSYLRVLPGSPSSKTESEPGDSPPDTPSLPIISQSFIDRILWPSTGLSEPRIVSTELSPHVAFSTDLTTRVRASVEYAFYSAEKVSKTSFAGSVTLYCPVPLGNPVLDSMLNLVADQVNADVLELDALELAAGTLGLDTTPIEVEHSWVPAASIFDTEVPRSLYSSGAPGTDERKHLEAFFTALINVPSARGTTRRIIYLRDIGSIAISAKPLLSVLLRAIQNNRKEDGASTILLVFGVSAKRKTAENSNELQAKSLSQKRRDSSSHLPPFLAKMFGPMPIMRGVKRDASVLQPHFTAKICGPDGMAVDNLSPLAFATNNTSAVGGGLKSLQLVANVDTDEEDDDSDSECGPEDHCTGYIWSTTTGKPWESDDEHPASWIESLDNGLQAAIKDTPVFIIEPSSSAEGPERQCLKQHILESRADAINRAAMRIIVRKRGACLSKEAEDTWVTLARAKVEGTDDGPNLAAVLPLSAVHLTASIAIGLWSRDNISSEASVVAPHHISQAHHLSQAVGRSKTSRDPTNPVKKSVSDRIAELKNSNLSDKEEMFVSRILQPDLLQKTSFSDVVIDPQAKETLRSIISLPLLHPQQFSTGILANEALSGILLYGPPGTGKTMICRALAVDFGVPMIIVQPSDIFEKYLGESEKMAKAVFLTEFMTAMDGIQTNGANGVVVIGATNRPFDLDTAILRRLPRRMLIDLPPAAQRKEILELYLRSETCAADLDIGAIARRTAFFSGSDLKNLCVSAALEAVNESILAPPAPVTDPTDGPRAHRLITQAHFTRALQLIPPTFSEEANTELYEWHAEYNTNGGP
ncbi:hypothetical protein HYPSUDRAFT_51759 [Hypholoma sublateritium FD-334 SS-4]|uniref:AAA+ ATPase domain-containing protein n=1 Tax=Hypholoma sublateritium (strain FD-334 SS-4) TaxID=945553 RepID=A0A0D2PH20_HYPSF|nr:hypothetical protein HYPSUDRAFT_51759 [Hypholoma sublateritium FD-334 SS-4]